MPRKTITQLGGVFVSDTSMLYDLKISFVFTRYAPVFDLHIMAYMPVIGHVDPRIVCLN